MKFIILINFTYVFEKKKNDGIRLHDILPGNAELTAL